jgi:hypothetical protein
MINVCGIVACTKEKRVLVGAKCFDEKERVAPVLTYTDKRSEAQLRMGANDLRMQHRCLH